MPAVLAVLAMTGLMAACNGAADPDPDPEDETTEAQDADDEATELDIAFVPATTGLLLNVAEAEGFFADENLDVELSEAQNISEIIPTLGQQFDISLGTATDLIRAGDSGLDVVQISGNTISTDDNPFVQLIAAEDSGIEAVTDLEGQRMASPTLSGVINMAVLYWAQQEGIDPESIDAVQVPPPNHPDQLEAGQVVASQALQPFANQMLAAGHTSLGDPFAAIGLPLATNFWMAEGQWAADNPEVVDGFVRALENAQEFIDDSDDNEAQARDVLQAFTGMPPDVAEDVPLPTFDLDVREDDLATWIEVLQDLDEFDGDIDPAELVR